MVNGAVLLPLILAGFVVWWFIWWSSPDGQPPEPDRPADETGVLPAMGHALGARQPYRYSVAVRVDAAPGLDGVRFHQDGHLIGEVLVETGEAGPFLDQVCATTALR